MERVGQWVGGAEGVGRKLSGRIRSMEEAHPTRVAKNGIAVNTVKSIYWNRSPTVWAEEFSSRVRARS